jgi:hypothetical protein
MICSQTDLLKEAAPAGQHLAVMVYKKSPNYKTICDFLILYTLEIFSMERCA